MMLYCSIERIGFLWAVEEWHDGKKFSVVRRLMVMDDFGSLVDVLPCWML
jgi:hypothetical protein